MVKNNSRSFTLIEILIVSAIVLVLSGISLAILVSYKDDRTFNTHVSIFMRTLEQAKNKASAGDVSLCGNSPTPYVDGYSVIVNSSFVILSPGCTTTLPTPISYAIPANIVYITPTFSLRFDGLNYQGGTRKFPIKNTTTNTCKYVEIDESGLITNGDYATCP